jgi:hypothetical protein
MSLMSRSSGKDWCSLTKTTLRITCDALSKHSDCNFSDWQVQPHFRLSASGFQCTLLLQIFGTVAQLGAFTSSHVTQIQRLTYPSTRPAQEDHTLFHPLLGLTTLSQALSSAKRSQGTVLYLHVLDSSVYGAHLRSCDTRQLIET